MRPGAGTRARQRGRLLTHPQEAVPMPPGELLNTSEAAKILGCSRRTLSRKTANGEIKFAQKLPGLRGDYLFTRSYIERLAVAQARRDRSKAS
jgi:excisionase family DNA binding protein